MSITKDKHLVNFNYMILSLKFKNKKNPGSSLNSEVKFNVMSAVRLDLDNSVVLCCSQLLVTDYPGRPQEYRIFP